MTNAANPNLPPGTTGLVLRRAALYDLTVWLMTLGRERALRQRILNLARPEPGESVVGCGTGALAIEAKRHVGPTGTVYGTDKSPEMLVRADRKARRAGLEIVLKHAAGQVLAFPDAQFDAALSTIMLHHLPRKAREQRVREIRRVLKPGGRLPVVDFAASAPKKRDFLAHFHRHGHVDLPDIIAMLGEAGLNIVESGAAGIRNLQFALAMAPRGDQSARKT